MRGLHCLLSVVGRGDITVMQKYIMTVENLSPTYKVNKCIRL